MLLTIEEVTPASRAGVIWHEFWARFSVFSDFCFLLETWNWVSLAKVRRHSNDANACTLLAFGWDMHDHWDCHASALQRSTLNFWFDHQPRCWTTKIIVLPYTKVFLCSQQNLASSISNIISVYTHSIATRVKFTSDSRTKKCDLLKSNLETNHRHLAKTCSYLWAWW